ncbi:N-6 DNA methylase [Phaeodactylibacter xiamenensis]|uniref:N-6 DNA methylase n=1 Tax=Phaeodactylibacter xiamenensis TaxID=1524460 RepID=UPI0024A93722|nr:N-6 DNA methylase [Phaeodactylibacter xiamenensis]
MMKSERRYHNPVDAVTAKLLPAFEYLRREPLSSNDYQIILFLLSLFKDGHLKEVPASSTEDLKKLIDERLSKDEGVRIKEYQLIYKVLRPKILRISNNGLAAIILLLNSIDPKVLAENFGGIFDRMIYLISDSLGKMGGEFILPIEISRLVVALADTSVNATVYNPFAGLASFGVLLDKGEDYYGQEVDQNTWAMGLLRLMAHGRLDKNKFVRGDSILDWPGEENQYDLIVANPPFGLRLNRDHKERVLNVRTAEHFLIEKGISSLSKNGKLIAVLPQGFLFRGGAEQRLRKHLIESDLIETIISLPGGLLSNTGIPLVILVINKSKSAPESIRFIDAKNFVGSNEAREKILDDHSLSSVVWSNQESEALRVASLDIIRGFDYNLNVPRYFQKEFEGLLLSEVLETVKGGRHSLPEKGRYLRIRDLSDDNIDFHIDINQIEQTELKPGVRSINESCLLLAIRWKTLKPSYFKYSGVPIFLSNDILAFRVDESIVNIAYLINELNADYVQEQLKAYQIGSVATHIRSKDLLQVKIKLPSLGEQFAKVQGIEELSKKIKRLQAERNALAYGQVGGQFNEFASLKHTLGRPRQNILDWADNVLHFLKEKNAVVNVLNKEFADFYGMNMLSALEEIKRDINFISEILEKGENGLVLSEYPSGLISLAEINEIVNRVSANGLSFSLTKSLAESERLNDRGIKVNATLFKTLIDNILTNADKHGFEKTSPSNEVVIELTEVDNFLLFEIKNNGKPFPKNFDKEKFISRYSTANPKKGSGLGGYDIHRIAKYFENPDWELIFDDPIYPVKFKFKLPVKSMK